MEKTTEEIMLELVQMAAERRAIQQRMETLAQQLVGRDVTTMETPYTTNEMHVLKVSPNGRCQIRNGRTGRLVWMSLDTLAAAGAYTGDIGKQLRGWG